MQKISVIVPVYNTQKYLSRSIESLKNQTFDDYNIFLIDDGSPDGSGKMCDEYALNDSRIITVHKGNSGQAASRNLGAELSQSEWIHFVDSDDFIHPDMLGFLFKAVSQNDVDMSIGNIFESDNCPDSFFDKYDYSDTLYDIDEKVMTEFNRGSYYLCTPVARLIRRSLFLKYPFTVGRVYEDSGVVFKWVYYAGKIAIVNQNLYFYQKNINSTTSGKFSEKRLDALWALEEQLDFYYKVGYYSLYNEIRTGYFGTFMDLYSKSKINNVAFRKRFKILLNAWKLWFMQFRKHVNKSLSFKGMLTVTFPFLKHR